MPGLRNRSPGALGLTKAGFGISRGSGGSAMAIDIAHRVYNHTFRIDPIIRTLLDTDFYKLLMLQMIWKMHPEKRVTFQLINRTMSVRLAEIVDERELIDQLDHARALRLAKNELIWLAGNTFYGTRH